MSAANFVLTLSCADRPGIVAAVTTELAALSANIAESNQFWDRETGTFFMRLAFTALKPTVMDFVEASLPGTSEELELAEIVVHPKSELAGKTLAGADVRRRFGVIVVALKRGDDSVFNPGPDALIEAGDVLVTLGPTGALEDVERASL